jgi:hypothetical protein
MGLILLLGDLALDNWTTQNEVSPKPKKRNAHEKHTSQRQMCRREKRFSRSSPTIWHREESPERANAKAAPYSTITNPFGASAQE